MANINSVTIQAIVNKIHSTLITRRYRSNSDGRTFAWNWKDTNYNRIALLNMLARDLEAPKYLEIGCHTNSLFDSLYFKNKTGVDPLRGGTIRCTSDQFFSQNLENFNLIFIDGLHTYDQVRKDVINSLRCLSSPGWIALHDMLPGHWIEAHVPRLNDGNWTGDVWKLAFELHNMPGIDFRIVEIDNGVGVIRKTSSTNEDNFFSSNRIDSEKYTYFADNKSQLPIISWNDFTSWVTDTSDTRE